MWDFERMAEQRIVDAIARGELDNLPGAGTRLELDDDSLVPPELRLAHRILKNAGYVPEEVQLRRQIADLERLLEETPGGVRAIRRLDLLRARLAARRGRDEPLRLAPEYQDRLLRRLDRGWRP